MEELVKDFLLKNEKPIDFYSITEYQDNGNTYFHVKLKKDGFTIISLKQLLSFLYLNSNKINESNKIEINKDIKIKNKISIQKFQSDKTNL